MAEGDVDLDFEDWVAPHLQAMWNLARRLAGPADADDIVQESLTRAWRRRETFRPDRGTPRAWLLAIVADRSRTWRRRIRPVPAIGESPPIGRGPTPAAGSDIDLERAIAVLAKRQRMAVELYYLLDLDVAEVAVVMGCAEGTVKSTLSDARAKLKKELDHP